MNNGCVCRTVRGDLIRVVEGLMRRPGRFDAIIVETTGLADPVPVAQTFFMDDDVRAKTELDAVVALVDAKHLPLRHEGFARGEDQIAFADVVLLNKTDLVTPEELAKIEALCVPSTRRRASIAPSARISRFLTKVLDQGAFSLERAPENEPHFLEQDHHDHDHTCGPDCGHDHHHHHDHDHHHHDHDHHDHDHGHDHHHHDHAPRRSTM